MSRRSILTVSPLLLAGTFAACSSSSESAYLPPTAAPAPGGAQPTFAKIVTADTPPPPISGGTLAVARDGRTVVASDPDRDLVYVVDVPSRTLKHSVKLAPGAEPGRVALDVHGKAHVALRSAGKVATVDLATGATAERTVCAAPRGIAYDATEDTVHVACADGDLVSTPLDGRAERRVKLDVDLRDVVVTKNKIYVSRFREADVLVLSRSGCSRASPRRAVATSGGAWSPRRRRTRRRIRRTTSPRSSRRTRRTRRVASRRATTAAPRRTHARRQRSRRRASICQDARATS